MMSMLQVRRSYISVDKAKVYHTDCYQDFMNILHEPTMNLALISSAPVHTSSLQKLLSTSIVCLEMVSYLA